MNTGSFEVSRRPEAASGRWVLALVVAAMNPEEFTGEGNYGSLLGTRLGLSHVPAIRVETATSSGVASGAATYANASAPQSTDTATATTPGSMPVDAARTPRHPDARSRWIRRRTRATISDRVRRSGSPARDR